MLNKGFTMIEVLTVVLIMSLFTLLFISNKNVTYSNQISIYNLSNNLINIQIESLKNRNKNCLLKESVISKFPICFNYNGNINISQNISLIDNDLFITLYLGAGTHEIKQR